jgi:agmatinase
MTQKHFQRFLESELGPEIPEEPLFHIIPAPYEKSVSYGTGTATGPAAILKASQQLELFDGISIPAEYGISTLPPLSCSGSPENVMAEISAAVDDVLHRRAIPMVLGGEHTVTMGALQAVRQRYQQCGVVQFDAHADLRDTYEGSRYSHACVMRRALDMEFPLYQVGVRSLSHEEELLRQAKNIGSLDGAAIGCGAMPDPILPPYFPQNIYLTIDVDVFDPGVMPATGTPEPGGLSWYQMMHVLSSVIQGRRVIGCDVVELAPIGGLHASDYTVARLIYNLFGMIGRNSQCESFF